MERKQRETTIFTLLNALLLVLAICAMAYAGDRPHGPMGGGFQPPGHLLCRAIHDNIATELISELTGKSVEDVKTELSESHMREVMSNNSIDPDTFRTAMDQRMKTVAEKAANCGLITTEQAAEIAAAIDSAGTSASGGE